VALALIAHGRAVTAGFIWDDDAYVTDNSTLGSLDGLRRIWLEPRATPQYYPLVHTTYWLEHQLWGLNPAGYHSVNVLLHAASSVLLWQLLRFLAVPVPWLGAAIFAVHPLGVESVAWVTERKNTLSMCCGLLAALAWLRYRFGPGPVVTDAPQPSPAAWEPVWLVAATTCFALAVFSKTVAAMLVGMLAVILWWKTGRLALRDVLALAPLVAVGLPLAALTVWLEKTHVGADRVPWNLSPADRLLVAGRAAWFYAAKVVWPQSLAFFYTRWTVDARQAWQWLFPAAATAVAAVVWWRRRLIGRGPAAVIAMFLCGLFPALGFFDVYPFKFSFVADHFAYHALPVAAAAVAVGLAAAAARLRVPLTPVAGAIMAALAMLAIVRAGVFHDQETLYRDTLAKTPSCAIAANNLGAWYQLNDRPAEAAPLLEQAAASSLFPDEQSRALATLAMVYLRQDKIAAAARTAEAAHAARRDDRSRGVLALANVRAGKLEDCRRVIAAAPADGLDYPDMLLARAELALTEGRFAEAADLITDYTRHDDPVKRNKTLLEAGIACLQHGRPADAERLLLAIAGDPRMVSKARVNLGVGLALAGKTAAALGRFQEAVAADPMSPDAHGNLAKTLLLAGRRVEALRHFEASRRLSGRSFAFAAEYEQALRMPSAASPAPGTASAASPPATP
jgi:Tfp pilus assembly protein PilF